MNGWIKLHRCLLHNPIVMKDADHLAVWCYLLLKATHKEHPALFGSKRITLMPGQLITGRIAIAKELNISQSKVYRILKCYENEHQLEIKVNNKGSLVTIVNWELYQGEDVESEQQVNNKRTTSEQQVNTKQECKNDKKDNKNIKRFTPPTVEEVSDYIRQQGYNVDPDNFVDFYESKGWKVGKETMKDWKASVRTWHRRNKSTTPSKVHNFNERSDTDWDALELKLLKK